MNSSKKGDSLYMGLHIVLSFLEDTSLHWYLLNALQTDSHLTRKIYKSSRQTGWGVKKIRSWNQPPTTQTQTPSWESSESLGTPHRKCSICYSQINDTPQRKYQTIIVVVIISPEYRREKIIFRPNWIISRFLSVFWTTKPVSGLINKTEEDFVQNPLKVVNQSEYSNKVNYTEDASQH